MPLWIPEPWEKSVPVSEFVDEKYAGNFVTTISHTGIIIYVKRVEIFFT